jgi:hypothetical protein
MATDEEHERKENSKKKYLIRLGIVILNKLKSTTVINDVYAFYTASE